MAELTFRTPICDLLDIRFPILLAGMGRAASPELAAAVSNAGGLGVMGAAGFEPDELAESINRVRELTSEPFGVDTLLPITVPQSGERNAIQQDIPPEYTEFAESFRTRASIAASRCQDPGAHSGFCPASDGSDLGYESPGLCVRAW